jgi:hypothetical protein
MNAATTIRCRRTGNEPITVASGIRWAPPPSPPGSARGVGARTVGPGRCCGCGVASLPPFSWQSRPGGGGPARRTAITVAVKCGRQRRKRVRRPWQPMASPTWGRRPGFGLNSPGRVPSGRTCHAPRMASGGTASSGPLLPSISYTHPPGNRAACSSASGGGTLRSVMMPMKPNSKVRPAVYKSLRPGEPVRVRSRL